jgi:hypothetical protein
LSKVLSAYRRSGLGIVVRQTGGAPPHQK